MSEESTKELSVEEMDAILTKRLKPSTVMAMYEVADNACGKLLGDLASTMRGTDENVALILALGTVQAVIEQAAANMLQSAQARAVHGHAYKRVAAYAAVDASVALREIKDAKKD